MLLYLYTMYDKIHYRSLKSLKNVHRGFVIVEALMFWVQSLQEMEEQLSWYTCRLVVYISWVWLLSFYLA